MAIAAYAGRYTLSRENRTMRLLLKYLLFILLPAYTYGQSGRPDAGITFEVTDSLHNPLAYATVALTPMVGGG